MLSIDLDFDLAEASGDQLFPTILNEYSFESNVNGKWCVSRWLEMPSPSNEGKGTDEDISPMGYDFDNRQVAVRDRDVVSEHKIPKIETGQDGGKREEGAMRNC